MNNLFKILFRGIIYYLTICFVFHTCFHIVEFGNHYYAVVFESAHMDNLGTCSLPLTSLLSNEFVLSIGVIAASIFFDKEVEKIEVDIENKEREAFDRWRNSKL